MRKFLLNIMCCCVIAATLIGCTSGEGDTSSATADNDNIDKNVSADSEASVCDSVIAENTDDDIFCRESEDSAVPTDIVVDALYYEKNIIPVAGLEHMGYEEYKHKIRLPKITKETANATVLNEKMYSKLSRTYECLKNNEELGHIYNVDYEYKIYNDVLGIVLKYDFCVQAGDGSIEYYGYYYDLKNDKEISFSEYLEAFGFNEESLMSLIGETKQFKDNFSYVMDYSSVSLAFGIFDDVCSVVYFNNKESLNEMMCKLELGALLAFS